VRRQRGLFRAGRIRNIFVSHDSLLVSQCTGESCGPRRAGKIGAARRFM
jgi:hypothetical protein